VNLQTLRFRYRGEEKEKLILDFKSHRIEVWERGHEIVENPFFKGECCFKHDIVVKVDGKETRATFFGSIHEYHQGKAEYGAEDLIIALECFVSDAIAYMNSEDIDDFAREFGYAKVSEVIRAYRGCERQYKKLKRLGFEDSEIYELGGKLTEIINKL